MAERTSAQKLTTSELIVQKLKETFDRKGVAPDEGSNVWVMAAAAKSFQVGEEEKLFLELGSHRPTHRVRVVLRTSDEQESNPYVDGTDFFLEVDERRQLAEFVWEEESFADAPHLHGSEVLTAIKWTSGLSEVLLCVRIEDPFQLRIVQTKPKGTTRQGKSKEDNPWT